MKHLHRFLVLAICGAVVMGCAKEPIFDADVDAGMIPMNIDGSIHQVQTKASAAGFSDKDAVGLFAVNYSEGNTSAGTLLSSGNQADNAKYVYDEPNLRWKAIRTVYYKDANTNADLYLYYPYQSSISDINAFAFDIKPDQNVAVTGSKMTGYEASDFLWGKATNVAPSDEKVPVVLNHMMSSAVVKLAEGTGFGDGEWDSLIKSVVVTGTKLSSTIDFSTGAVIATGEVSDKGIVMVDQEDGSFRAIVVPQEVEISTPLFAITIGTTTYRFKDSVTTSYQGGKMTSFDITVNKKTTGGEYEFQLTDSQITDWIEDKNSHGGEARQYFVVNVAEVGKLGKTIKDAGKNSNRIRNLKVTGQIGGNDFAFMRDSMKILEAVNLKECRTYGAMKNEQIAYFSESWADEWNTLDNYISQYGQPDYSSRDGNGYMYYEWYKYKDWDVIPVNAFANKKTLFYFVFPEDTKYIAANAFSNSGLSGALVIPDNVSFIGSNAFYKTSVSSVTFNDSLEEIDYWAFAECSSLSGDLLLPDSLTSIGDCAFQSCSFSGRFILPENLESIGYSAFNCSGKYSGDLEIPENLSSLSDYAFSGCTFNGSLNLNNVTSIGNGCFQSCGFKGELILPEGMTEINEWTFNCNQFSSVSLPSTLRKIGRYAFQSNWRLCCDIVLPEGVISIGEGAFSSCSLITAIELPSTIQTIQSYAFNGCSGVSRFVCSATVPPLVQDYVFDGIAKDNFTLEVPAQSVKKYQSDTGWADFKRISAHYDFSISRNLMRGLNAEISRTYVLRAPSGFDWSVQSKPDWVTVTPSSGTGKTDVTITFSEMPSTQDQFEVQEAAEYGGINYSYHAGRSGEIVFKLNDKDYTSTMDVQQFQSDYADGQVTQLNQATKGSGIDIVFIGDGYDAKDIAEGKFNDNAVEGFGHFFDVEPYKTYKDYFNVYTVVSMSNDSGIGTVNQVKDVKFGSYFTQNRILTPDPDKCFTWATKANPSLDINKSLTVMLMNTSTYEGITWMCACGAAIACCPVSGDPYPYDFRGIIQHEAGGHGFGKLGDEYIYHNAFIQTCGCCCCDHPQSEYDLNSTYGQAKLLGWYKNLSMKADASQVPWAHLIKHPSYSDYVDMYEGGYMHTRGMFRSEATSCMNNNIPYYNAISRQAIVERIMEYAGETFSLEEFYAKDNDSFGTITKGGVFDRTFGVDPNYVRATGHAPVIVEDYTFKPVK